jgi:cyclic pyranopterin phosphate synthase
MSNVEKIEVILWHRCNCGCVFCSAGDSSQDQFDPRQVASLLMEHHARGVEAVAFGGGEPTIYQGLPTAVDAARKLGYKTIEVKSNGMRFCYPEYAQTSIQSGINLFTISLWGHDPETHDQFAGRPNAFEMTEMGIKHLVHYGACVHVDLLLTVLTVPHLEEIVGKLARMGVARISLWLFCVFGAGGGMKEYVPRLKHAGPAALAAADAASAAGASVITSHIPPCFLQGRDDLYFNIKDIKLMIVTPGGNNFMAEESAFEAGAQVPECEKCVFRGVCAGPRREYLELFGHQEIKAWNPG